MHFIQFLQQFQFIFLQCTSLQEFYNYFFVSKSSHCTKHVIHNQRCVSLNTGHEACSCQTWYWSRNLSGAALSTLISCPLVTLPISDQKLLLIITIIKSSWGWSFSFQIGEKNSRSLEWLPHQSIFLSQQQPLERRMNADTLRKSQKTLKKNSWHHRVQFEELNARRKHQLRWQEAFTEWHFWGGVNAWIEAKYWNVKAISAEGKQRGRDVYFPSTLRWVSRVLQRVLVLRIRGGLWGFRKRLFKWAIRGIDVHRVFKYKSGV